MSVGERIEELLWEQGRRKDWLAREMRIHPSHLSRLLSGERNWTKRMQIRAAAALGVDAESLFLAEDARQNEHDNSKCA